ncbi:MAG TPA: S53 family peptidase [Candidatus Dormibacteraeota bacterium]
MGRLLVASLVCLLGLAACTSQTTLSRTQARQPPPSSQSTTQTSPSSGLAPLEVAIRDSRDLGPILSAQPMSFDLTLADRDPNALQDALASGSAMTSAEFASRFGPDPARVAAALRALTAAGLTAHWTSGAVLLTVSGSADAVERFLRISIHRFVTPDGTAFYSSLTAPAIPAQLAGMVIAVTGLDNYVRDLTSAVPAADVDGVTPADMTNFYDITPLRKAGLDGTGQTVVFLEWGVPPTSVLNAFAKKFTPTVPFNVEIHQDAADWGAPLVSGDKQYSDVAGEAALDLEIVHGIAPGAHEVVYEFSNGAAIPDVIKAIAAASPHVILSSSISEHECEHERGAAADGAAENQVDVAAAAQGMSIFWASGDRGAYMCLNNFPNQDANGNTEISVMPDASSVGVTAVGGTTAFLAEDGGYFQESAWGEPVEQWGSGGGMSTQLSRPTWQVAPGITASMTGRGVPDVAANADILSGWDIIGPGQTAGQTEEGPVGGTSAAAPFWAAVAALIDENLSQKSLPPVGFANPALYLFAQSPPGLPAPAFHDITLGSNLHFAAGPGWDMATGLGTPDVGALTNDFEWYEKTHGASG